MRRRTRSVATAPSLAALLLLTFFLSGCRGTAGPGGASRQRVRPRVQALDISGAAAAATRGGPIVLHGARNEWVSFAVEITDLPPGGNYTLRLRPPRNAAAGATIHPSAFEAAQLVDMPVDVNRAGYVRHTGHSAAASDLPRALVPVPHRNGVVDVRSLRRDPAARAADDRPAAFAASAPRLWVDLKLPPGAPAGDYAGACELFEGDSKKPLATLPLNLSVYDLALPDERDLQIVGRLSWDALVRLYPDRFGHINPRLLARGDGTHAAAVATLDQLVSLAQRHRLGLFVPRLQPTVKWPVREDADAGPLVDWDDFDRLVDPWLSGDAFADKVGISFWPLPVPDHLQQFDRSSQLAYWAAAAHHFDQRHWIDRAPVWLETALPGRARPAQAVELSQRAGQILRLHERLRVALPLEDDQLQLTERDGPEMIDLATAGRLWAAAPGLVFSPPAQLWPLTAKPPRYWLRTDLPGLMPYAGAGGDQRDLRLWAWLAFLRNAALITFGEALPAADRPDQAADPNETIWFYPGHWFGRDEPVPTVQLKWLRRAQQDYQYLHLARQRGEVLNALVMARLITKPVQIQPGQAPDPAYALMCGTADGPAWDEAQKLLARSIVLRLPERAADAAAQQALYLDTLRWAEPQERPLLIGRTVRWLLDDDAGASPGGVRAVGDERTLSVRLGVDIYNASYNPPDRNRLRWSSAPPGWQVAPEPTDVPLLAAYQVRRESLDGRFRLGELEPRDRRPVELTFTNGFTNRDSVLRVVLPVATSERVAGREFVTDGQFYEWDPADLVHDGALVQMMSRPVLQRQELRLASTVSRVYTGWAEDNFCVAFAVGGITPENLLKGSQNFVDYEFRRAWGEDLCGVLIQPVFDDNSVGPVLHLVCKPTGSLWVERKLDARRNANPWQPLEGTGVRYKAVIDNTAWRGEVAIPWRAICDAERGVPALLRFNFVQHRTATGESASWAGPIDFGRDDAFTGVLHLREAREPGMAGAPSRRRTAAAQ